MYIPLLLDTTAIIFIAVGAGVAAIGIFILLYFTVFSNMRYKKQVREISRRFEYLHALLFGQDSQYLKRIEIISKTNLLYVETHMTFNKRYKDVRDKGDSLAQTTVNNLKDLLAERNYKALKVALPLAKETIDAYDDQVNSLNNDLLIVIKPEEDCRQQSLLLKENLRKIKQDYYVKQADLTLVSASFDQVFRLIDDQFKEFESLVECAAYEDARALLPKIGDVIKQLSHALTELPNICITIQSVIPDKLSSLQNRYADMRAAGYPLHHLIVEGNIEEMRARLDQITERVKNFNLRRVQEQLDNILATVEGYFEAFEREKEARVIFDNECEEIYQNSSSIDKKFIRLCNALPDVKKIFIISEEEQNTIDSIKLLINKAGATKRSLDTFIHSGTKQPYTILVEKMHTLRDESEQASAAIDDFNRYLFSLKSSSEEASGMLASYYDKLKEAETTLRQINVESESAKFKERIDDLYQTINDIYLTLRALPIDVAKVDSLAAKLKSEGDSVCLTVHDDYESMRQADAVITYANRDRQHLGELSALLEQCEALYFEGDFRQSHDDAIVALKHLRGE